MTEKVIISTEDDNEFTFENNINGDICEKDKDYLVYVKYYDGLDEEVLDSFGYDDAIKLRDFLDWLIKKADRECKSDD